MNAPLYGLVLTGGHSRRMQRDKAQLPYAGRPQLARAMDLIAPLVARRFVSIRADQTQDPQRAAWDGIADRIADLGPIGGIHAALHAHPQHAWLVLACDLPFLDTATLQHLLQQRDATRIATAYRSSHDGLPEPLCAIFEPAARTGIDTWIAAGHRCPRHFLAQADTLLLTLPTARALDNINTADEYAAASAALSATHAPTATPAPIAHLMHPTSGDGATPGAPIARSGPSASSAPAPAPAPAPDHASTAAPATRRFQVQYFALLREQAGRSSEAVQSIARTPAELYEELRQRRGLTLAPEFLRVAVNESFSEWTQPLADGDRIVFLPPVAGG